MHNQAEIQQKAAPTKKRIGRARFLLEFIIAAAIVKLGFGTYAKTTVEGVVPLLFLGIGCIGYFLAIWASMKRLRDIRRSEWWVTVLIAPLLLGVILGIAISISGPDVTANAYVKTVGVTYMVIYVLFLGVLLFWPSAFAKGIEVAAMTGKQPSAETNSQESKTTTGVPASDIEDKVFAQAAAELDTNQRDAGVWARAYSEAEGDENRAKALYIRYRVQRIGK